MKKRIFPTKLIWPKKQAGSVLPVVLAFLVIMTLLGITAIRNVTLEETMAGNLRNQELAFQAAEEALRDCERVVLTPTPGVAKFYANQPKPWYQLSTNQSTEESAATKRWLPTGSTPNWTTFTGPWADANYYRAVALKTENSSLQQPRCMVESLEPGAMSTGNPGDVTTTCPYRITARAFGVDTRTVVVLQSYLIVSSGAGNVCD